MEYYKFGRPNSADHPAPSAGLLLVGGGDRNVEALRWFFDKAGGGDIVVLSASYGREIGVEFFEDVGGLHSVQIFVLHDRKQSTNKKLLNALAKADGIFIAGGDQARYIRYWRGTPVHAALQAHIDAGKPLGGTSAGLAMLGQYIYGAMDGGSLTSPEALADPFGPHNTIEGDYLEIPHLRGVITDTHFKERDRLGRLFAFVAKAQSVAGSYAPPMIGLGVDESAALAVDSDGRGHIFATADDGYAWIVDGKGLPNIAQSGPLNAAAVRVRVAGKASLVHLPSGRVEQPIAEEIYRVSEGKMEKLIQ